MALKKRRKNGLYPKHIKQNGIHKSLRALRMVNKEHGIVIICGY